MCSVACSMRYLLYFLYGRAPANATLCQSFCKSDAAVAHTAPAARYRLIFLSPPATANCFPGASAPSISGCHAKPHTSPSADPVQTARRSPTSHSLTAESAPLMLATVLSAPRLC